MSGVVVVTGGSRGIGRAAARLFAQNGYRVYEFSRSGSNFESVCHITVDITDRQSVEAAFRTVFEAEGRLDVLVNNAGFGISGAVEFADPGSVRRLFDANFFGALNCIQCALPYFRKSGGGRIINVSSVAAAIAIPFQSFYSAAKAALNSLTLSLINELNPFSIKVCAVMPGDVRTGFTASREKSRVGEELYGRAIERAVAVMESDEENGMAPELVAQSIYRVSRKKRPKPFYVAGKKYKFFMLLFKLLPAGLSNRIVGSIYR